MGPTAARTRLLLEEQHDETGVGVENGHELDEVTGHMFVCLILHRLLQLNSSDGARLGAIVDGLVGGIVVLTSR